MPKPKTARRRLPIMSGFLTDGEIEKFTFKPKPIYREILKTQADIAPFYDIEVAQYVIDPSMNENTLSDIFGRYTDMRADDDGMCVTFVSRMRDIVAAQLEIIERHGQHELLYNIEFPLTVVLADMENCGFYVDRSALERYSKRLTEQIDSLEKRIYFLAGEQFNINSPKQMGVILFESWGCLTAKRQNPAIPQAPRFCKSCRAGMRLSTRYWSTESMSSSRAPTATGF